MPFRNTFFEKNIPFHIVSRSIEEQKIFNSDDDCCKFIVQLYVTNIGKAVRTIWRKDVVKLAHFLLEGNEIPKKFIIKEHPPLVHFLGFALVANHYHFYLVPNIDNAVPIYIKKLNGGFAKYFNLKYGRKGSLFGSRYKGISVTTDNQSDAVDRYINIINPLDIYQPGWRESGLIDQEKALNFLENYPFSSYPDRIGKRNSKILASKKILEKYLSTINLDNKQEYIEFAKDFLKQRLLSSQPFFLE